MAGRMGGFLSLSSDNVTRVTVFGVLAASSGRAKAGSGFRMGKGKRKAEQA